MKPEQLAELICEAGVIGAGGAGFPTHKKLAAGIDTVLINAAECEPLLRTDYTILSRHLERVLAGARELRDAIGAKTAILCLKHHNAEKLGLSAEQTFGAEMKVCVLPDAYPMGDEIVMIYQAVGRVVPPGQLPSAVGVVVINAETAYNIWNAIEGIPVTQKWLTIGGKVPNPMVVRVPVGADVKAVFAAAGVTVPAGCVVIDGGPAMGTIVNPLTARVSKKTKALLILPEELPAVTAKTAPVERLVKRTSSACCQCTFCTDLCPRHLLGYPLQPHKTLRAVGAGSFSAPDDLLTASLCSGCGVCTLLACCQGIAPSVTMTAVKRSLSQNRLAYRSDLPTVPDFARDDRMVPISRLMNRIGVAPYDHETEWAGDLKVEQNVFLFGLTQHVGKPSIPIVAVGDRVNAGQMIARADEGISAAVHTSVSGIVTRVDRIEIEISTGEVK